jgi:hypothetical protein
MAGSNHVYLGEEEKLWQAVDKLWGGIWTQPIIIILP